MSLDHLRIELREHWKNVPATELCEQILNFIEVTPREELKCLTFATLCRVTGRDNVDSELLTAINILAGSKFHALDAHAFLVDEDDTEHPLSPTDIAEARTTGELIHPETGRAVADYEKHIIPFFSLSRSLMEELE